MQAENQTMTNARRSFMQLREYMNSCIVGQSELVDRLLIALLADGHLLVEGAPGLAKTKAIKKLSEALEGDDQRIQFTPDLLPSDITGSDIYRPETGTFQFQPGPVFHNLIWLTKSTALLRKYSPLYWKPWRNAKLPSAGKRISCRSCLWLWRLKTRLSRKGRILARSAIGSFLMYVKIGQPDAESERRILKLVRDEALEVAPLTFEAVPQTRVFEARREALGVHLSPSLEEYIVQLVMATRRPEAYGDKFKRWVAFGASPRGTIALDRCARAKTWLEGRDYVLPEDIHAVVHDVLRHRVILTFEAEAEGITPDSFLDVLLNRVPMP